MEKRYKQKTVAIAGVFCLWYCQGKFIQMNKPLIFSASIGWPTYNCSCGTHLKEVSQGLWLIKVENHPETKGGTRKVYLKSTSADDVCPNCKTATPLTCTTEDAAKTKSNQLNEKQLTEADVFWIDGD